jgi:hypothetical protein
MAANAKQRACARCTCAKLCMSACCRVLARLAAAMARRRLKVNWRSCSAACSAGGEPHVARMMRVSTSRVQLHGEQRPALRQAAEVREGALRMEAEAQRRAELAQHQQLLGTMQCGTLRTSL